MTLDQIKELALEISESARHAGKQMDLQLTEQLIIKVQKTCNHDRISASDRVMLATRTEAPVTPEMLQRFQNVMVIRLLHAGIGLATEAGEFLDQLKKHLFYGKPLDMQNLREELGDSDWYMNLCCDVLNTTMALIEAANIRKLATRYGEKFSEDKALLRNISAELAALDNIPPSKDQHIIKFDSRMDSLPGVGQTFTVSRGMDRELGGRLVRVISQDNKKWEVVVEFVDDIPPEHKEHGNKQSYTKVSRPGDPGHYSD